MKSLLVMFLIICATLSCSKDENFDPDKYPQKWVLVKMTGQIPNSETTGENMEWQEYYLLNPEGSFMKHREREGIEYEAAGSFTWVDETSGKFLELTFNADNEIIGNCFPTPTETLWLKSEDKLLGTWSNCDGPGLEYERKE